MTYGALVVQLIQDYEDYGEVNKQLEKMGYNIGTRLIEDFLARSNLGRCIDFRETGVVVAKVSSFPAIHLCVADLIVRSASNPFSTSPQPSRTAHLLHLPKPGLYHHRAAGLQRLGPGPYSR